jgi:hypothetical protein
MGLLNIKQCSQEALEISIRYKGGKFTRVGKSFKDELEEDIRVMIYRRVMRHPSKGKTLMGERRVDK